MATPPALKRDPADAEPRIWHERIALAGRFMGGFMALQGGASDAGVQRIVGIVALHHKTREYQNKFSILKEFNLNTELHYGSISGRQSAVILWQRQFL